MKGGNGVLSLRRAVSGQTQNSSGNLKILLESGDSGNFLIHKVTKNFGNFSKIQDDFYLPMILLKQHLLELLPPLYEPYVRLLQTVCIFF